MSQRPNRLQTPLRSLRWLAPLSVFVTLAGSAASPCSSKTYELNVPDPATLKLKDGEHVIAAVGTDHGKLEVRVQVKGGVISDNEFWANGKRLKEGQESDLRPEVLKCMKTLGASLPPSEGWVAEAARAASSLIENSAEAKNNKNPCLLKVTATCYQSSPGTYFCAYRICCGNNCYIELD
jgi:hypothetical protein